eukprot:scaffold57576_cov18-Tisochrysis_lutea.AAC.1
MHALQAPNICHQIRLASSARPITRPSLCASKLPLTPKHHLHVHTAAALAGASPQEEEKKNPSWKPIVAITAVAMLTCNLHRSVFTMLLPDLSAHHLLTLKDVLLGDLVMLVSEVIGHLHVLKHHAEEPCFRGKFAAHCEHVWWLITRRDELCHAGRIPGWPDTRGLFVGHVGGGKNLTGKA